MKHITLPTRLQHRSTCTCKIAHKFSAQKLLHLFRSAGTLKQHIVKLLTWDTQNTELYSCKLTDHTCGQLKRWGLKAVRLSSQIPNQPSTHQPEFFPSTLDDHSWSGTFATEMLSFVSLLVVLNQFSGLGTLKKRHAHYITCTIILHLILSHWTVQSLFVCIISFPKPRAVIYSYIYY